MRNFTIPFEIGEAAHSIRDVELLVSQDRGRRWHSVDRQPVEAGKFAFRADEDGEYWFAFRTTTIHGNVSPMSGTPQLRVMVDTTGSAAAPSPANESRPITPPRPVRFRDENAPQLQRTVQSAGISEQVAPQSEAIANSEATANTEAPAPLMLGPRLPGFEFPDPATSRDGDLLDNLLSEMSPFLDVQPVPMQAVANRQVVAGNSGSTPTPPVRTPPVSSPPVATAAGSITDISLNNAAARPQIVVRWNTGNAIWQDAQIDVFRGCTKERNWAPIAINLSNSGEYWWFLTPEDFNPFYVAVRIRSLHGTHVDATQWDIRIDPRQFPNL